MAEQGPKGLAGTEQVSGAFETATKAEGPLTADKIKAQLGLETLEGAKIRPALYKMQGAQLAGENLRGAYLAGGKLEKANFEGADLRGADLSYATLTSANLRGADLRGANLEHANLNSADISGAIFDKNTNLDGAYLDAQNRVSLLHQEGITSGMVATTRDIDDMSFSM